jgi:hypothetical protein
VEKTLAQVHWLTWRILWRGLKYANVKFGTAAYKKEFLLFLGPPLYISTYLPDYMGSHPRTS